MEQTKGSRNNNSNDLPDIIVPSTQLDKLIKKLGNEKKLVREILHQERKSFHSRFCRKNLLLHKTSKEVTTKNVKRRRTLHITLSPKKTKLRSSGESLSTSATSNSSCSADIKELKHQLDEAKKQLTDKSKELLMMQNKLLHTEGKLLYAKEQLTYFRKAANSFSL